ncbi:hypothetical protein PILCRDRAFT_11041 [Piloderma croceum F 1598]|uniref:Uncharacterized protein n=1 Tax=Piloderma croceum (strain F 1598) TaxID=765440 RepID=A0A0C3FF11_PILCF|nr:hypothetical protein PILCRDRAFT_11041 [Piloderma croceum F 1598]
MSADILPSSKLLCFKWRRPLWHGSSKTKKMPSSTSPPTILRSDCHQAQPTWQKNFPAAGAVDRWLATNIQSPYPSSYLLMGDGPANEVLCIIRRFHIVVSDMPMAPSKDPDTFILYITASVSPELGIPPLACSSPRATLARYVGFSDDLEAPEWTRWGNSILSFRQPKGSFADLFARMATWEENRMKGLPYRMIEWAKAISVGSSPSTTIQV